MISNPPTRKRKNSINIDAPLHVTGQTMYLDDMPEVSGTLYAKVFFAQCAHGVIAKSHLDKAAAVPGVIRILAAADIPAKTKSAASSQMRNYWRKTRFILLECRCLSLSLQTRSPRLKPGT